MAVRRLAEITAPGAISEVSPLDLDLFNLAEGDDITLLLTDIVTRYGSVYVRAPSKTVGVVCDTISFTVGNFVFLEDQSAVNKLTIQHAPSGGDSATISILEVGGTPITPCKKPLLWHFSAPIYVKIGGSNLSMTFIGTHRGLHQPGDYFAPPYTSGPRSIENIGLVHVYVPSATSPNLLDFRANVRFSERYALFVSGTTLTVPFGGDVNRFKQVNVAGLFYATAGIYFQQGVKNVWFDPDRTVLSDPYLRGAGWGGGLTGTDTLDGRTRKYSNSGNASYTPGQNWYRLSGGGAYYADSLTGGVTFEYGVWNFVQRVIGHIGTASQPFVVRVKDWCVSGPGTPYEAGVTVPSPVQQILFKGDPAEAYGNTQPFRFIHWMKLPSTYGDGCFGNGDNLVRVEANDFSGILNYGYDVKFSGDWYTNFWNGTVFQFEYSTDTACRTWGHVLRLPSGTTMTDQVLLLDTDTVVGPGTYSNLSVTTAANVTSQANTIRDCRVSGAITVGASTGTTTVSNVQFTGSSRAVMTIASGTTVNAYALSAPAGSTITGTGTLNYSATVGGTPTVRTLPFAVPTGDSIIVANGLPNAPTGGSVV
jgi:hypothetical protein